MRFREAPLPAQPAPHGRCAPAEGSQDPEALGEAIGRLLLMPPQIDLRHVAVPRVSVVRAPRALRGLLRRGAFSFDEAVRGADRMTVAVTLFALLELYKRGEADWEQGESFGEIAVHAPAAAAAGGPGRAGGRDGRRRAGRVSDARRRRSPSSRARSRRCCSSRPIRSASAELAEATQAGEGAVRAALALLAERHAPGRAGIALRELGGGWTLASDPASEDAARRLFSRPRVSTLTPAQAETLAIVAYLQPVSRPEIARIRGVSADSAVATLLDRGLIEEAGRSQFGAVLYRTTHAVPQAVRPAHARRAARRRALGPDARGAGRAARAAARGRRGARGLRGLGEASAGRAASWPQAASMSRPRVRRTVAGMPRAMQRGAEGGDRRAGRALVGRVGRVVRDQVDLEDRALARRARAPAARASASACS